MGVHRTLVKHCEKIIFIFFPSAGSTTRHLPPTTMATRGSPFGAHTFVRLRLQQCCMLKTKDRHHTASRAECQAGRRKIFAIFVPGVLGRWIESLRGRLPGVSCHCPARQSPATGSDGERRLGRDTLECGAGRPRCRPGTRTFRDRFSAALIAIARRGALPSCLLVARPRAPLRPPGATALGWNDQRRSESAATPHRKVGIRATGRRFAMGALEQRNAAGCNV